MTLKPSIRGLEWCGLECALVDASVDAAPNQTRPLEDTNVLGDSGERNVVGGGEVADLERALLQPRQKAAARTVRERREHEVELIFARRG
jgi:hypothetical protein